MGGVLRFRVVNHHCTVRMPQHDGPGFEEAAKNLIEQTVSHLSSKWCWVSVLVLHDGHSRLCTADMYSAGPSGFPASSPRGHQMPGKEGLAARLSILTYSWYSAAFAHAQIPGTASHPTL